MASQPKQNSFLFCYSFCFKDARLVSLFYLFVCCQLCKNGTNRPPTVKKSLPNYRVFEIEAPVPVFRTTCQRSQVARCILFSSYVSRDAVKTNSCCLGESEYVYEMSCLNLLFANMATLNCKSDRSCKSLCAKSQSQPEKGEWILGIQKNLFPCFRQSLFALKESMRFDLHPFKDSQRFNFDASAKYYRLTHGCIVAF